MQGTFLDENLDNSIRCTKYPFNDCLEASYWNRESQLLKMSLFLDTYALLARV